LYEYSLDSIHWQTGNLFPNLASGSYTVFVRDGNNCTDMDTLTIQPTAPFFIVAATADTTLEYLDTVQLTVTLNDTTQATSVWSLLGANGGVLDTNVYQILVAPANTGSYHFVAMNQNGCQVDTTIVLTVAKPRNANAPKAFTPNGDGTNDTFFIQGDDKIKSILTFRVYDRWGELVYEGTDLQPNDATTGWDGTLKGKPMNSGTFAWYAEVEFKDGTALVFKGDVTLLR
jgi:gliding motility-associated-like protein